MKSVMMMGVIGLASGAALAGGSSGFEGFAEGFYGDSFSAGGINFYGLNSVSGMNVDGSNFEPGDYGTDFIVENAGLAIADFPDFLSGQNALSTGRAFVPGVSLSVNIFSDFSMSTGSVENAASMNLIYYENGPWGGIRVNFDAMRNGQVVASDSFEISDLGGRDNLIGRTLSVSGVEFDEVRLHATLADGTATAMTGLFDNVVITPAPGAGAILALGGLGLSRRRR